MKALEEPSKTSVRINDKIEPSEIEILDGAVKVGYCDTGYSLPERPDFTLDPLLHAGAYYVQEASSMYLGQIIGKYVSGDVCCLDLCAAPGGKSTHLASLLSEKSLLVSNEIMPQRANVLAENIVKWGNPNTIVTNNKPSDFAKLKSFFDVVVTDVPCSGEGMFRKEPKAVECWSMENVMMCAERQRSILTDVWSALKEGGLLVYSTCTFNHFEDEDNVEWIASELGAELLESRHFYFHNSVGEGFFIAALRKTSSESVKRLSANIKTEKPCATASYIKDADCFAFLRSGGSVVAVDKSRLNEYACFMQNFRTLKCGVEVAAFKGRDEIPSHQLAMSKILNIDALHSVDVDKATALQYLRKEAISVASTEKGYMIVTYKGLPLGWIKNLGNRCNNLYPEYWRIRK